MAQTLIEWTHRRHPTTGVLHPGYTFNGWIGCTKVPESPACAHCYAAEMDATRFSKTLGGATPQNPISHWGVGAPRYRTTADNWKKPEAWNRAAERAGIALCVFAFSLGDVFDEEVPDEWRDDFFELVYRCPNLEWMILTKRTAKMRDYLTRSSWWVNATPQHVWLGATMENQKCFDARIGDLLATPAKVHFASMEPLFGAVNMAAGLKPIDGADQCDCCGGGEHSTRLDMVIVGGESRGNEKLKSRPMHPDDAHAIATQCWATNTAFYFKQWGDWAPAYDIPDAQAQAMCLAGNVPTKDLGRGEGGRRLSFCVGKAMAGHQFEGKEHRGVPYVRKLA